MLESVFFAFIPLKKRPHSAVVKLFGNVQNFFCAGFSVDNVQACGVEV